MHSLGEPRGLSFELEKHEQEVRTASSCYLTYGCLFSRVRGLTEWATKDRLRAFLCTQSEGNANDMLDMEMTWCPQTAKQPNQTCASSRLTVIKCRGALLQPGAWDLLMEHQQTHTKASDSHICWWGRKQRVESTEAGDHSQLPEPHTQPQWPTIKRPAHLLLKRKQCIHLKWLRVFQSAANRVQLMNTTAAAHGHTGQAQIRFKPFQCRIMNQVCAAADISHLSKLHLHPQRKYFVKPRTKLKKLF